MRRSVGRSVGRSHRLDLDGVDVWKCMRGDGGSHFSSHAPFISTPSVFSRRARSPTTNPSPTSFPSSHFFRLVAAPSSPLITRLLVKFVSARPCFSRPESGQDPRNLLNQRSTFRLFSLSIPFLSFFLPFFFSSRFESRILPRLTRSRFFLVPSLPRFLDPRNRNRAPCHA